MLRLQSKDIADIKIEITTIKADLSKSTHDVVLTRLGAISHRLGVVETNTQNRSLPPTLPTLTQQCGSSIRASDFI